MLSFADFHLRDTQVLNPHWATNGVYKIINAKIVVDRHGRLDLDLLEEVLAPTEEMPLHFPSETHGFLVELMSKFELCYPVEGEHAVLVPNLLTKNSPDDFELEGDVLTFQLDYTFLPPSVMPRFMVRLHKDIARAWRNGVILQDPDTGSRAVVQAHPDDRRITIMVAGPRRRDYLMVIRFILKSIAATFARLEIQEKVQLPDDPNPRHAFSYSMLLQSEKRGIAELPAINGRFYKVADLLGRVQVTAVKDAEEERVFVREAVTTILNKLDPDVDETDFLEHVINLNSPVLINPDGVKKFMLKYYKKWKKNRGEKVQQ